MCIRDRVSNDYQLYRILGVRIAASRLEELAAAPWVEYVQAIPAPDRELNSNSMYTTCLLYTSLLPGPKKFTWRI